MVVNNALSILPKDHAHLMLSVSPMRNACAAIQGLFAAHRRSGRKRRLSPKKVMLTRRATITRACSASSLISKTHPVSISLRHISSGSHKKVSGSRPTGRPSPRSAVLECPCGARRG
eukprot:2384772-Prymnesium_polylepis.3